MYLFRFCSTLGQRFRDLFAETNQIEPTMASQTVCIGAQGAKLNIN